MKGHVMLQFEATFGTSLTTSLEAVPITAANLVKTIEPLAEAGMYGRFAESPYHDGKHAFAGEITMEANPIAIGWFMRSVIGWTSVVSDTNTQTHVFKPRTSDFSDTAATDCLTIEQHYDVGSAGVFNSMCGNTLGFNIANGELLSLTAGFIGAGFTRKQAATPTFPTAKPFKWDQMSGTFNGAAITDIQDLTVNVNNQLEARYTLQNTSVPRKIKRTGFQQIEVSGTITFQAHSYWQAYEAGAEYPLKMHFVGAQAPNALTIDLPLLRFKSYEPVIAGPGVIEASFTAQAMYSTSSATALQITLVNTQQGYLAPGDAG